MYRVCSISLNCTSMGSVTGDGGVLMIMSGGYWSILLWNVRSIATEESARTVVVVGVTGGSLLEVGG